MKRILFTILILLSTLAPPALALELNTVNIDVFENGDVSYTWDYSVTWPERVLFMFYDVKGMIRPYIEKAFDKPLENLEVDSDSLHFTVRDYAEINNGVYSVSSLNLDVIEKELEDKIRSMGIVDWVMDVNLNSDATVRFFDGTTRSYSATYKIPVTSYDTTQSKPTGEWKAHLCDDFAILFDSGYWSDYTVSDFSRQFNNVYKPDAISSQFIGDYAALIEGIQYFYVTFKTLKNAEYGSLVEQLNTKVFAYSWLSDSRLSEDFTELAAVYRKGGSPSRSDLNDMLEKLYIFRCHVNDYKKAHATDVESPVRHNIENAITFLKLEGGNLQNTYGDPK